MTMETDDETDDSSVYNLRMRKVGINQILNVYIPSLHENVNQLYIH